MFLCGVCLFGFFGGVRVLCFNVSVVFGVVFLDVFGSFWVVWGTFFLFGLLCCGFC